VHHETAGEEPLAADDEKTIAMQAYINHERRCVPMAPGKH
jgi:hypothetical protein